MANEKPPSRISHRRFATSRLEMRIPMKKKNFLFCICLCAACILSGCSVLPRRPSTSNVETFAKTYINESVESAGKKHAEVDCYGKNYYYPMVDNHGIEFNVIVENKKVMLVEAYIPFLYSKNLFYSTDYKERIMAYYTSEIEVILEDAGVEDYKFRPGWIEIYVTADYSLEDLAAVVIAIDNLLDYDCYGKVSSRASLGKNQYWDFNNSYDILIQQRDDDNNLLLHKSFLFSDNNYIILTYEEVLKELELSKQ